MLLSFDASNPIYIAQVRYNTNIDICCSGSRTILVCVKCKEFEGNV